MIVFISYSHQDKGAVERIAARLRNDGHDVWLDSFKLRAGDNIAAKILEGIEHADVLIVVVSENSQRSAWVQREFSAIALHQISKRERRIIPIRLDDSPVPSYLANRLFLDLSQDFDHGLSQLSAALAIPDTTAAPVEARPAAEGRSPHVSKIREALKRGRLTLVCGAGVSVQAGIPAWGDLLLRLLEMMMDRIARDHSIDVSGSAAAEFQNRFGNSSLILGKYLKHNLGKDFLPETRAALYSSEPTSSPLIDSIVDLARPQRDARPLDSVITFNFDCLIEENLSNSRIPNKPIYSEAIKHDSNELPVYHVHGYLPRSGRIPAETDLVFSEDAYHSQFIDPFSWSNLIQLNKLTQNTCLFVGISLTDPNMRRLLDVAWRKNPDKTLSHYIIKRAPSIRDGNVLDQVAKLLEEQDANALGLNVLWIDDFADIPSILAEIVRDT